VIVAAAAGGFFAYRLTGQHAVTLHSGVKSLAPTAASSAQSAATPALPVRRIPEELPELTLTDRDGVRRSLSEWRGRPLVINFWATWCAPCRREIPLLKALRQAHARDGLEVIGIAVDLRQAVLDYAREMRIDYPVLIGEDDALAAVSAFGMDTVFPFTVFADRQGRVVTLKVGELHPDEGSFILERLTDLDQGRLTLASAREQIAAGVRSMAADRARQAGTGDRAPGTESQVPR
jgi:thiol-disulfide isomerase/thioredoxin